ncbi:MAG: (Fe-S)-binding protein, partial [Thermodesulfobacteriota bacterium]
TLFIQCIVDSVFPKVGQSMVRVLDRLGVSMDYPEDQTCCGQPAFNSGYRGEARAAAKRFIEIFEDAETIVCPSGSCVDMVRNHYDDLFENDSKWLERARLVGERTFEFSEFLVDVLKIEDVGASFAERVTYHDSCHLMRGIGVSRQPRKLIANVKGIDFVEMHDSDRCCGFGGAFSFKYPDISTAMLEDKVRNIEASGAQAVVGCDMGCLMNIQGMLNRKNINIKTMHIAELLDHDTHS